ncbi:MAG: hypothetical protein ACD_2C00027G0003 [uncultured bacterium (gcode 4)]|uniref:Uncharacterized protein n=1 Tax=uncultured bacterium (gcode 4) TaxID=1234023 RepID=K2H2Z1_9BACT|nr:MAG: hypothetical protein ACD_2C00027G0003 [uncultured bacterium (gcode 4)]
MSINELSAAENSALMTLDDLDTLWGGIWTKVRNILEDWMENWSSTLKVQEDVRTLLDEIWLWFSQIYIDRWEFIGMTLDKLFK